MTESLTSISLPPQFPDHTQLPESDGTFVKNFQEHPQSLMLTDSLSSVLQRLHPDGQYAIGQDCGIYWRETEPPERGAEAPDWFYVPNVPPKLGGKIRRSYVLWREFLSPLIALEFASGDGSEERDCTPLAAVNGTTQKPGKFWVYEQIMRIPYYGIYQISNGVLEVYNLVNGSYVQLAPNQGGHYAIAHLEVELGVWDGSYQNQEMQWLRWWDLQGSLLLTGQEAAGLERQEKEQALEELDLERQEKGQMLEELDQERLKRQQLTEKLRSLTPVQLEAMGIDPQEIE